MASPCLAGCSRSGTLAAVESIRSGALTAVGYDPDTQVLTVTFESGGTYAYHGVPPMLYEALLAAQPHPWRKYGARVRRYPYERID